MERLKSITSYPYCANDAPIVGRFWRVFEGWTEEQKSLYLRFVWGRCRIPIDCTNLSYRHEVRLMTGMDKNAFPQAHTCFFQLDVPDYETDEIMRRNLTTAIEFCGETDNDNTAAEDLD